MTAGQGVRHAFFRSIYSKGAGIRPFSRIFSFPVMLASLLILLSVLTARSRFDDPDMWWHLRTGQIIWESHTIPTTDVFSYTTDHHATVPHEWLSQLLIYAAYQWNGFAGLMLWLCFFTSAVLIAGYLLCWLYSGDERAASLGALLIWLFGTVGIAIRPQMIGYLLLIVELLLIQLGRTRNPRWFLCLPILFAIWVNCHGSFFLGFLIAGIYLFSSFYTFHAGSFISEPWNPRCRRIFLLALLLSVGALFFNPDGLNQVLYPLNTVLHQPIGLQSVDEWKALQMDNGRGILLLAVILLGYLMVLIPRVELYGDELLLLSLGTWLGVSHARFLFVFGILSAPVLSRQLATLLKAHDRKAPHYWLRAAIITSALVLSIQTFPRTQYLDRQVEEDSPVGAVNYIVNNHLPGPLLNDYTFGGYLIWALRDHPVFVDGRSDVYEWTGILSEFDDWEKMNSKPDSLLQKYHINLCLLSNHSSIVHVLPLLPEWKTIYSDNNSVIFERVPQRTQ